MKAIQIFLITSLMLLSVLAGGCDKDDGRRPPWEIPDDTKPHHVEFAPDISFDTLSVADVQQFLQEQGKWIVEARYIGKYLALYYDSIGSEKYFEFIGKDTLRLFTDTGLTTYKSKWVNSTSLYLFDADGKETYYTIPGIWNYRLKFSCEDDESKIRFNCIPEERISDLPKPYFSQKDSLDRFPIYRIMPLMSGTKWKLWEVCSYGSGICREPNDKQYFELEFIGTNTLRIIRNSGAKDYEIGQLYEDEYYPGSVKGFCSSYYLFNYYRTLEEAGENTSIVLLYRIYEKTMKIRFFYLGVYDLEEPTYQLVLVE